MMNRLAPSELVRGWPDVPGGGCETVEGPNQKFGAKETSRSRRLRYRRQGGDVEVLRPCARAGIEPGDTQCVTQTKEGPGPAECPRGLQLGNAGKTEQYWVGCRQRHP
jgi:hypothetical protein